MSLSHAQHNERLCLIIHGQRDYNDWVCTTAFYSAMHFVYFKIFPLTLNRVVYHDFNQYYRENHPRRTPNKHEVTKDLVSSQLNPIHGKYRQLLDLSCNARYSQYNIADNVANRAIQYLADIKQFCEPSRVQIAEPTQSV